MSQQKKQPFSRLRLFQKALSKFARFFFRDWARPFGLYKTKKDSRPSHLKLSEYETPEMSINSESNSYCVA